MAINFFITIGLFLVIFVALIFAQIKLSSMENKYFGLILPGLWFILSLAWALARYSYISFRTIPTSETVDILFIGLLIGNIPTFIYLFIYFGVREKNKINKQIDKMNINDL